jgi:WD40 repeat protein
VSTALSAEPARPGVGPAVSATSDSPYVGPRPFNASEWQRFFGRDREAVDLKHRVMAHPITVLYAMSGAGKTSLINARVVPDLMAEGCVVLPSARVRGLSWKLTPEQIKNVYVFHALMSWQTQCDTDTALQLKGRTLKEELTPRAQHADQQDSLLIAIFDQCEELFTAYSSRWGDRRGFFEQLADALQSIPNLRVLLAMREDYLASLDPYASLVPESVRSRFRLERLRREAALEAVTKPLECTGRRFAPGVASKLIDSLMTIIVRPPRALVRGRPENVDADLLASTSASSSSLEIPLVTPDSEGFVVTSEYVEPVQLQVVCQNLWSSLQANEVEITAAHLVRCGDVDQALARFYENCVKEVVELPGPRLREGAVRRWFAERLITPTGTRGLVLRGSAHTGGLANEAVELLESRHLVTGEDRGGARWYELSHDRFLAPIINSNLRWQRTIPTQAIWSELEERAAAWDAASDDQKPSLLLNQADLARAEAWRKGTTDSDELGVSDQLKRLLDESRDVVDRAELAAQLEAERREAASKARRVKLLTAGAAILAVLVLITLVSLLASIRSRRKAQEQQQLAQAAQREAEDQRDKAQTARRAADTNAKRARISKWAMQAQSDVEAQPSKALALVLQTMGPAASEMGPESDEDDNSPDLIRGTLARVYQRGQLGDYSQEVTDVTFAPRDWGSTLRRVPSIVVALGGKGGKVELWDLHNYDDPTDDELLRTIRPDLPSPGKTGRWVSRVAFDPRGRMLAFATGDISSSDAADRGGAWVWVVPKDAGGEGEVRPLGDNRSGPVSDIAFSPGGDWIAIAGNEPMSGGNTVRDGVWAGTVRIFDAATLKPRYDKPVTVKGPAQSVVFDSRGERIAVASGDVNGSSPDLPGEVAVIGLKTWAKVKMEYCEHPAVRAVFSPDGKAVVSGGNDGIGRVHDPATGRLIATLVGHAQQINALAFSRDGTRLVTASGDRSARVWNPSSWSAVRESGLPDVWSSQLTLVGHKASLLSAEFNAEGTLVLTAGYDRTVRVWDAQTGECLVAHIGHEGAINAARFSERGVLVATAGSDKTARILASGNVEAARLVLASRVASRDDSSHLTHPTVPDRGAKTGPQLLGHDAALRDVQFRPGQDGRFQVLTAGADGVACLWDVSGWNTPSIILGPIRRFETESPRAALTSAAFSLDGQRVATASFGGTVRVWDVDSGEQRRVIEVKTEPTAGAALGVTFSPKGTYLLTAWADGMMRLYRSDGDDPTPLASWPGSAFRLTPQLFDQDERFVVTPSAGVLRPKGNQGSVQFWDVEKPSLIAKSETPAGNLGPVADLAVHPQTHQIAAATAGISGAVVVWDEQGHLIGRPLPHPGGVERLTFSPDGKSLATEAADGMGRLWSWPLGERPAPSAILPGLTGPSAVLTYSGGATKSLGEAIFLASDAGAPIGQLWDHSGKPVANLKGPRDRVVALAFLGGAEPEVLSINRENRLQRWSFNDAEKGWPVGSCRGPSVVPTAAAIRTGGDLAASGTETGMLKLWRLDTGEQVAELFAHKHGIQSLIFSADGRRLASADRDGLTCVWPVPNLDAREKETPRRVNRVEPKPLATFTHQGRPVSVVRFLDPDGRKVVTGIGDIAPERWQAEADLRTETAIPLRFTWFDLESKRKRPDPESLNIPREGLGVESPFGTLATLVSPRDGRIFVALGGPQDIYNIVRTFNQPSDKRQKDTSYYRGHTDAVLDLAISPDGTYLATASADNTARVWKVPNHKDDPSIELRGHSGDVSSVAYSPDGEYVLTISRQDGTARVWDRDGGETLYILGTHRAGFNSATLNDPPGPRQYTDDVVAAAFSGDGKLLATAHGDGSARVFHLELCGGTDDLKQLANRRLAGFKSKQSIGSESHGQAR